MNNILVTGGAGFIGSGLVRVLCGDLGNNVTVLDALTYAGDRRNLEGQRAELTVGDVCDRELLNALFGRLNFDTVFHLAAESHVDRSIEDGTKFVRTNAEGTAALLEAARIAWAGKKGKRFVHVSTDEVYGSLPLCGGTPFSEDSPIAPNSPYAASKAASDLIALSYHATHGLPVVVTRCTNNYGPRQHAEKFIPNTLLTLLSGKPAKLYGDGKNVRDWIHVNDHCAALVMAAKRGVPGRVYNIGARSEKSNAELVSLISQALKDMGHALPNPCFVFTADRKGHDRRYAIDPSRAEAELGWRAKVKLADGLKETVMWYGGSKCLRTF